MCNVCCWSIYYSHLLQKEVSLNKAVVYDYGLISFEIISLIFFKQNKTNSLWFYPRSVILGDLRWVGYGFHLLEWALNQIRHRFIIPPNFVPPLP